MVHAFLLRSDNPVEKWLRQRFVRMNTFSVDCQYDWAELVMGTRVVMEFELVFCSVVSHQFTVSTEQDARVIQCDGNPNGIDGRFQSRANVERRRLFLTSHPYEQS